MVTKPKVLLAVDGSPQSMLSVVYVSQMVDPKQIAVELFHVKADAPEAIFDLVGEEGKTLYAEEIGQWAAEASSNIDRFMEQAEAVFLKAGFPAEQVTSTIRPRQAGIARDILEASKHGCAALAFGRNGYGALGDYMLGSVAAKLVEAAGYVPLVIVGGGSDNKRIMVAFDRSRRLQQGLDQVGKLIDKELEEMLLCHIVRPLALPSPAASYAIKAGYDTHWLDDKTQEIIPHMVETKKRLSHFGFDPEKFRTAIIKEKISRAKGLFDEAEMGGFGTIIIGRRGLTLVEAFSMGRVTRKVIHMAIHQALWVV